MNTTFAFSAGVWNINTGMDPFGPEVRASKAFTEKLAILKALGMDYVQFHDDDAVPMEVPVSGIEAYAARVLQQVKDAGLKVEFVAPRLWEDPDFVDGAITANSAAVRAKGLDRARRTIDIANYLETDRVVLWPAREGTYIRESKDAIQAYQWFLEYLNTMLQYDPKIRLLGEMKPNEPMDLMYAPSTGHFLALALKTCDPTRVGVLIESAHSILLGLDPSDEMAYAAWHGKLWGVHLNDQDGLKFDEDKSFGSVNLRRAFNQVDVLVRRDFGAKGEVIGLDVKAMRTQPADCAVKHLSNSKAVFEALVDLATRIDRTEWQAYVDARDYEGLDLFILRNLMGSR